MPLVLHDTLTREKRAFEPREPGQVSMYVCGPTVQAAPHVGHGRMTVVFDVLRRWLEFSGYGVRYVMNITDVDDKIILRASREGLPSSVVAERNTAAWNAAMALLNVRHPDVQPRATGHIQDMIDMIQILVDRDMAYAVEGSVLFRVRSFEGYGKLSNRKLDDMQQGEDGVTAKEDVVDFAMWKAAKPGEPSWPSPWGPGRPGWHIECSAMAARHLGGEFDIHGGGLDLVFPHHENEITQYEAAHDRQFARYWVHNGMVRMGEEKMSKSLGNIVSLEEAVETWGTGPVRVWYLGAHHRSPLTFEDAHLDDAVKSHGRLLTFLRQAWLVLGDDPTAGDGVMPDLTAGQHHIGVFSQAMDDDLNVPRAVAALHDLVSEGNDLITAVDKGDETAHTKLAGLAVVLVDLADRVLGLDLQRSVRASVDAGERFSPLVDSVLEQRRQAREDKDWATADRLREQLAGSGVVVEDRPGGSRWYVEPSAR